MNRLHGVDRVRADAGALSACGGGGGGGGGRLDPATAADADADPDADPDAHADPDADPDADRRRRSTYNTAEYQRSNGAVVVERDHAPGRPARPARGQDRGDRHRHQSRRWPNSPAGSTRPAATSPAAAALSDEDGHGTAVTAIAAAARNDAQNHGRRLRRDHRRAARRHARAAAPTPTGRWLQLLRQRDRRGHRRRAAGRRAGHQHVARRRSRRAPTCSPRCSARSTPGSCSSFRPATTARTRQGRQCRSVRAERRRRRFPGQVIIAGRSASTARRLDSTIVDLLEPGRHRRSNYYLAALGYAGAHDRPDRHAAISSPAPASRRRSSPARWRCSRRPFPTSPAQQIVDILFRTRRRPWRGRAPTRSSAAAGSTSTRAFQPIGTTSARRDQHRGHQPVDSGDRCPAAAGDGRRGTASSGRSSSTAIRAPSRSTSPRRCAAAEQRRPLEQRADRAQSAPAASRPDRSRVA